MRIFSGGMPRASYGDRHTVTVIHGGKHVVFDFASKVIDFFVICDSDRRRRLSHSIGEVAGLRNMELCPTEIIVGSPDVRTIDAYHTINSTFSLRRTVKPRFHLA